MKLNFARVAGDLTCGADTQGNEMKRRCDRNANGGSNLYSLACERLVSVAASSLTVMGANEPHTKHEMIGYHFMSQWKALCFLAN